MPPGAAAIDWNDIPAELVLPGGVPHGTRVVGDEPVETLNALAPRRDAGPTVSG